MEKNRMYEIKMTAVVTLISDALAVGVVNAGVPDTFKIATLCLGAVLQTGHGMNSEQLIAAQFEVARLLERINSEVVNIANDATPETTFAPWLNTENLAMFDLDLRR